MINLLLANYYRAWYSFFLALELNQLFYKQADNFNDYIKKKKIISMNKPHRVSFSFFF